MAARLSQRKVTCRSAFPLPTLGDEPRPLLKAVVLWVTQPLTLFAFTAVLPYTMESYFPVN